MSNYTEWVRDSDSFRSVTLTFDPRQQWKPKLASVHLHIKKIQEMESLSHWRQSLSFPRFGGETECHTARLDKGPAWIETHSETHTAGCPLPPQVPRNRCCATSCLARRLQPPPPVSLAHFLQPSTSDPWQAKMQWGLSPSPTELSEHKDIWHSQTKTAITPSIITPCIASLPHKCRQKLVWIPSCLFLSRAYVMEEHCFTCTVSDFEHWPLLIVCMRNSLPVL